MPPCRARVRRPFPNRAVAEQDDALVRGLEQTREPGVAGCVIATTISERGSGRRYRGQTSGCRGAWAASYPAAVAESCFACSTASLTASTWLLSASRMTDSTTSSSSSASLV